MKRTVHRAAHALVIVTSLIFGGCSAAGNTVTPTAVFSPSALAPHSGTIKAYRVQLSVRKTMFVPEPATVAIAGNDVTVTDGSGRTDVFHGSSPTVQNLTARYTFTPRPNDRATQCFRPPCVCPVQYSVYPYDQGTSYYEQAGSVNWEYVLVFLAPSWDDNVSGTETTDFSGYYTADGSYFDMNFGSYPAHYSATSYSQFVVYNGGASQDAIGLSTLLVSFTDINNATWDAKGIKSRNRCT